VQQRFLTDDEINDARAMIGWQFWFAPMLFGLACLGSGWVAATGEPVGLLLFILFSIITIVLWTLRLRQYKRFTADIDHRTVEVLEGAPQKIWVAGKTGDCYLQLSGHTIKVPNDCYGVLKDATIVKVAFLPTSHIAVRVEAGRGIGLS
jgi:membrane protein implicated in regulation of membrane protease activity